MLLVILELLLATALSGVNGDNKLITCYGYAGSAFVNNTRCPGSNACCGADATCLSNRLCHKPNDGPNTFLRGPCATDPYDSGTCAQICLYDETTGVLPRVRACSNGSLCCDNDDHCCDDGNGIFLDENGLIADSTPSIIFSYGPERTAATFRRTTTIPSATPSTTSIPQTTTAPPSETSTQAPDSGESSNNSGVKIGLGVGIPVACLLIGLCAWLWWRQRKARKQASVSGDKTFLRGVVQFQHQSPGSGGALSGKYELPAQQEPVELEGNCRR